MLFLTSAIAACGGGPLLEGGCIVGPCGPPAVGDVSGILPSTASIAVGDSIQFSVYSTRPLVWSVDNASVGAVTATGLFRARAAGATTIAAIDTGFANYRRTATVFVNLR